MAKLPSGFYELPSGRIQWKVMVNGVRTGGSAKTLGEAQRARAQALLDGGARPTGTPSVRDVVDAYMADLTVARSTAEQLRRAEKTLPQAFLDRRAVDVTPAVVAGLWRQLAVDQSPHTVLRARDILSKAWQQAILWEWVPSNPFTLVAPPPARAERINPPDVEQVRKMIAAVGKRPLALWLRLAALLGARRGELCGLQWSDVRLDKGEIVIWRSVAQLEAGELLEGDGKTGSAGHRVLALDLPTITALRRHTRIVGCPWVFSHDGVTPWRPGYVTQEFGRLMARLELDEFSPHDLRHFAATQWLGAGVPVPTVAYMLGHSSPATTLRVYAHWIPAQARDAIAAHGALLGEAL